MTIIILIYDHPHLWTYVQNFETQRVLVLGSMNWYLLPINNPDAADISLEYRMYTPVWNVILWILISQNHFHSTEIHLGSENWQYYISNGCVRTFFIQVRSVQQRGKNKLTSIWTMSKAIMQIIHQFPVGVIGKWTVSYFKK